jgi:hypothetical protein
MKRLEMRVCHFSHGIELYSATAAASKYKTPRGSSHSRLSLFYLLSLRATRRKKLTLLHTGMQAFGYLPCAAAEAPDQDLNAACAQFFFIT